MMTTTMMMKRSQKIMYVRNKTCCSISSNRSCWLQTSSTCSCSSVHDMTLNAGFRIKMAILITALSTTITSNIWNNVDYFSYYEVCTRRAKKVAPPKEFC